MLNTDYKHRLATWQESGFKKYPCPSCGKKSLVPLVDAETGTIIDHTIYGRCDREIKCGYYKRKTGKDAVLGSYKYKNNFEYTMSAAKKDSGSKQPSYIYNQIKMDSLDGWTTNNLVYYIWKNLKVHYDDICDKVYQYHIGTSTHTYTKNAPIFWQTDYNGNTRSGKVIQYSPETGKRIKSDLPVRWMHTNLKLQNYNYERCLFGEHLLKNKSFPVAIVESEKTALIQSLFNTDFIWLATGGKGNLKDRDANVLQGRDVSVYPDVDAEDDWFPICQKYGWNFKSTRQEMLANGYTWNTGDDLADMTCYLKAK